MKKKGTAYIKMVCSFVAVFCLALCVVVLFYLYSSDVMEKQVDYSNKNLLSTVQSVCDQEFRFYENVLKSYSSDAFVQELGMMDTLDSSRYADIEELTIKMRASISSMDSFDGAGQELLLYFPRIERICSVEYDGMLMSSTYGDLAFSGKKEPMDALLEQLAVKSLFSASVLWDYQFGKDMLLLTRTCWSRNDECEATVGVMLDVEKLSARLSAIEWEYGCNWLILDENNNVLKGVENVVEPGTYADLDQLEQSEGYFINEVASEQYNWKYVLLVPKTIVENSLGQIRTGFAITLIICLLLGFFLIRKILVVNYAPLQNLLDTFQSKREHVNHMKDEYAFLHEQISSLITTSADMKRRITRNDGNMKKLSLVNLLVRPFARDAIRNEAHHLKDLDHGENMVLIIKERSWQTEAKASVYDDEQKLFIIDNVFNEKVGEKFLCRMVEVDDYQVLIVHDPDLSAHEELLWEIVEDLQQTVSEYFDLHITLAGGGIHDNLAGVHESYMEALEAEEFISILDQDSIDYDDVRDNMLRKYDYSMQAEERIVSAIRNNNVELATSFIDRVLERNFVENRISVNMRQCLLHALYCTLLKAADEKGCIERININQNSFGIEQSPKELLQKYSKLVKNVCTEEESQSECSVDKELCQKILFYVQENYQSYDLNISQTARYFRMSPSALSSMFKRETGKSLLKHINDVRIEKAIEFLHAGYSVAETAEKVGISESSSFIRLFKKYVGVTPGQMKTHMQQSNENES